MQAGLSNYINLQDAVSQTYTSNASAGGSGESISNYPRTVALWARSVYVPALTSDQYLFCSGDTSQEGSSFCLSMNSGRAPGLAVNAQRGTIPTGTITPTTNTPVTLDGDWHFYVISYAGGDPTTSANGTYNLHQVDLYVDGVKTADSQLVPGINTTGVA